MAAMASLSFLSLSPPATSAPPSSAASPLPARGIRYRNLLFPSLSLRRPERDRRRSHVVRMAPEEEKITRRSPLDFPIEWERPKPGRRPDIFPQFSPMKTPLPPPLPADPPEEDEEDEEEKKEEEEEGEDPDKENPDKPQSLYSISSFFVLHRNS